MSRVPEVGWAQRQDKVFITVLLPDAKNAEVNLEPERVFNFSASAGAENHEFELKLDLFNKVNVEESKINIYWSKKYILYLGKGRNRMVEEAVARRWQDSPLYKS
ncbi:hypothetical protein Ddye_027466 [Dipteronia dyeriana]|uniref:Co-chaperone protein p23 n=1 Tax=Dipteronia dyeriana TaxID=168575 RepID=A0AAD9TPD1_9ROSI|nr:hypothetical protein Ddye_027466 [Dipteronia dyeriana]